MKKDKKTKEVKSISNTVTRTQEKTTFETINLKKHTDSNVRNELPSKNNVNTSENKVSKKVNLNRHEKFVNIMVFDLSYMTRT
jgi:hypothetical protein